MFTYTPKGFGNATMELTGARAVGVFGDTTRYLITAIENGTATTVLAKSKYDLNRDGVVDALDLGIMLLYCGFDADGADWATLVKVNDAWGNGVTASMCDVNGDGLIDMLDLLDLFIHFYQLHFFFGDCPSHAPFHEPILVPQSAILYCLASTMFICVITTRVLTEDR